MQDNSELIIYSTEDGLVKVDFRADRKQETIFATVKQMAEIFDTTRQNIELHIKNILSDGELFENSVCKDFLLTASDGKNYNAKHYNLDMIIAVGYRVNSKKATQFRIWATKILHEYMIKGFAMDDERLKDPKRNYYFDELLARIREIRASEKLFYQKVKDIYSTSIDYDKNSDDAKLFFKVVQNKMLFAVCGKTAAELIIERINENDPSMGLTSWDGSKIRKGDIDVAKNYLKETELRKLYRITSTFLEFAELQAEERNIMYMKDWEKKLDDVLKIGNYQILNNAGKISHEEMERITNEKYEQFDTKRKQKEKEEAEIEAEKDLKEIEEEIVKKYLKDK